MSTREELPALVTAINGTMAGKVGDAIRQYRTYNIVGIVLSFCLMFNVIARSIFNSHAKVKVEADTWANADTLCAAVNLTCFFVLDDIQVDDVLDASRKRNLNFAMWGIIFTTWRRILAIATIVESISPYLMTCR